MDEQALVAQQFWRFLAIVVVILVKAALRLWWQLHQLRHRNRVREDADEEITREPAAEACCPCRLRSARRFGQSTFGNWVLNMVCNR